MKQKFVNMLVNLCKKLLKLAQKYMKTDYGKYLKDVAEDVFGEE